MMMVPCRRPVMQLCRKILVLPLVVAGRRWSSRKTTWPIEAWTSFRRRSFRCASSPPSGCSNANYSASSPEPCRSLNFNPFGGPASTPQQKETAWSHPDFTPPLKTFFTVDGSYDMRGLGNAVIAPSGIEVYKATGAGAIPGWANSVLITSLFKDAIFRVKLSADGTAAVGNPVAYFREKNRYRDVTVSPDGRTIFVSTDNWGVSTHPGAILAFTYQGNQ
jgi:hypothetical protein